MNCQQTQNMLDDYLDGNLSPIQLSHVQSHLHECGECQHVYSRAKQLATRLKDMPVEPASADFEQRMLGLLQAEAREKPSSQHFMQGFATAIAASFLLWFVVTSVTPENSNINSITVAAAKPQTIDLVFNLPADLADARLTIELPEQMEIIGHPGKQQLSWTTNLKKGSNRLALPIISKQAGSVVLVARLGKGNSNKVFRVRINANTSPTSLFIDKDTLLSTTS